MISPTPLTSSALPDPPARARALLARATVLTMPWVVAVIIRASTMPMGLGDSQHYMLMAQHPFQFTSSPHGYRILVPYLAALVSRLTSLSLDSSFLILSIVGFVAINLILLDWTSRRLGHSLPTAAVLCALYSFSYAGTYNLHNFVHIGFYEHLMILLGVIAIALHRFSYLASVVFLGGFVKETAFLLIPVYCAHAYSQARPGAEIIRRTLALLALFGSVFLILRSGIIFHSTPDFSAYAAFYSLDEVTSVRDYYGGYIGAARQILAAFPILWPLFLIGFLISDRASRAISLLVPLAVLQILLATDVTRMTAISFPAVLLLVGNLFRVATPAETALMSASSILVFYLYNYGQRSLPMALIALFYGVITVWYFTALRPRVRGAPPLGLAGSSSFRSS